MALVRPVITVAMMEIVAISPLETLAELKPSQKPARFSTRKSLITKRELFLKRCAEMCISRGGYSKNGGSGEIRTHGGRKPSAVFKTAAFNHSATLPQVGKDTG